MYSSFEYTIIRKWLKQPLFVYNKKIFYINSSIIIRKTLFLYTAKRKDLFMKTLYVSDLDGTLLRKNETLSTYTKKQSIP